MKINTGTKRKCYKYQKKENQNKKQNQKKADRIVKETENVTYCT